MRTSVSSLRDLRGCGRGTGTGPDRALRPAEALRLRTSTTPRAWLPVFTEGSATAHDVQDDDDDHGSRSLHGNNNNNSTQHPRQLTRQPSRATPRHAAPRRSEREWGYGVMMYSKAIAQLRSAPPRHAEERAVLCSVLCRHDSTNRTST